MHTQWVIRHSPWLSTWIIVCAKSVGGFVWPWIYFVNFSFCFNFPVNRKISLWHKMNRVPSTSIIFKCTLSTWRYFLRGTNFIIANVATFHRTELKSKEKTNYAKVSTVKFRLIRDAHTNTRFWCMNDFCECHSSCCLRLSNKKTKTKN